MTTKKFCDKCGVQIATQKQPAAFKVVIGQDYADTTTGDGRDSMSFLPGVWFADACVSCVLELKALFSKEPADAE